ncbi:MAG: serine/threonine protein kinase [Candidatus Dadabacteria bacterium]|nr:MAG: serine/threonine protein kinase [Candidatus Dadabacteria bacterium]
MENEGQQPQGSSGKVIADRYEIIKRLGQGAMGTVYLARDRMLSGETIALKVLHALFAENHVNAKRFLREVLLMRKVTHKNVVRTFDVGRAGRALYYTMEYAGGTSLKERFQKKRASVDQLIEILHELCQGLEAIHNENIVHRDVKPGNVLVTQDGTIKIADFGIARQEISDLTLPDEAIGSALYMAPEVWSGEKPTAATDIYSLGVMMYQLATGSVPFAGRSPAEVMKKHLKATPASPLKRNPELPAWLNTLILQMLSKDPAARPASAREIAEAIESWSGGQKKSSSEFSDQMERAVSEALEGAIPSALLEGAADDSKASYSSALQSALEYTSAAIPFQVNRKLGLKEYLLRAVRFLLAASGVSALLFLMSYPLGEYILRAWSGLMDSSGTITKVFFGALPALTYAALFAVFPAVLAVIRGSWKKAALIWTEFSFLFLVSILFVFNFYCYKVGYKDLRVNGAVKTERIQLIAEAAIRRTMEAAFFLPKASLYRKNDNTDPLELDIIDPVFNFKNGLARSELPFSERVSDSDIVLIKTDAVEFVEFLPQLLISAAYLFLLLLVFHYHVAGKKLKKISVARYVLFTLLVAGLITLEFGAEDAIESFLNPDLGYESLYRIGPFTFPLTGYVVSAALLNWLFIALGSVFLRIDQQK